MKSQPFAGIILHAGMLFLVGLFAVYTPLHAQPSDRIDLNEGWRYRWGESPTNKIGIPIWIYEDMSGANWDSTDSPKNPPNQGENNILWLRKELPDENIKNPHLFLMSVHEDFEVYLDNKFIDQGQSYRWYMIPIEDGFQGKVLTLKIQSGRGTIGLMGDASIASKSEHIINIILGDIDRIILSVLFILVGAFQIFVSLRNRKLKIEIAFGSFMLCVGIYAVARTLIKQLFFDAPDLWRALEYMALYLTPVGITMFIEEIFGEVYKKYLRLLWLFHLGYGGLALVMAMFGIFSLASSLWIFQTLLAVTILSLTFVMVKTTRDGGTEARIFMWGFGILAITGIIDLLVGVGFLPLFRPINHWGMFVFIIAIGFVLAHHFSDVASRLETYTRELEGQSHMLRETIDNKTLDLREKNKKLQENAQQLEEVQEHADSFNDSISKVRHAARAVSISIEQIEQHLSAKTTGDPRKSKKFKDSFTALQKSHVLTKDAIQTITDNIENLINTAKSEKNENGQ